MSGWGTKWKAIQAQLPANAEASSAYVLAGTCHSATLCLEVGVYGDSSGYQGLLETRSGTSWQPAEAPLPANFGPPAELDRVACPSATACFAFGESAGDLIVLTGL
jgi:hypothetical protein